MLIGVNVSGQESVNKFNYQQEVLSLINQYGEDFDDCFPPLPLDFPELSQNYSELNEIIGEVTEKKWYHRSLSSYYFAEEMHEIFFHMEWGTGNYAISILYYMMDGAQDFTIYSVSFLGTDIDPNGVEFGHTPELLIDITESSLREIDACKGTPGFEVLLAFIAFTIAFILMKRSK